MCFYLFLLIVEKYSFIDYTLRQLLKSEANKEGAQCASAVACAIVGYNVSRNNVACVSTHAEY